VVYSFCRVATRPGKPGNQGNVREKIGQGSHGIVREFRHWSWKYLMKPF
jgi:hypothetical protein